MNNAFIRVDKKIIYSYSQSANIYVIYSLSFIPSGTLALIEVDLGLRPLRLII